MVRRALTAVFKCLPAHGLMLAVTAASLGWPLAGIAAAGHCPNEALELAAQSHRDYLDCNHYPDANRCRAASQMAARATAVGPQCGVAWTVLARQWIDAGRRDDAHKQKARDYAARALQFAPDDPEALRVVGRIHFLDRQYAQARERFDQAARSGLTPRLATNYAELAQAVSTNAGQLLLAPEAKTWYERALEVSIARGATRAQFDPDARLAMSNALFALGRDAAERGDAAGVRRYAQQFDPLVLAEQTYPWPVLNAAALYMRSGDYVEAERAARFVLANNGGWQAQRLLAQALIMQGWQANMAGDTATGRRLLNAGFGVDAPPRWLIYDLQNGSAPMQEAAKAYRWRIQLNILLKDAAELWQRITA